MTHRRLFASAWLDWLDQVQAVARRNDFPEDPQLTTLRAWHDAGVGPVEAALRIKRGELRL